MHGEGGCCKEQDNGKYAHRCMMCGKEYRDSKDQYYYAICQTCKRGKEYEEGCHDSYEVIR